MELLAGLADSAFGIWVRQSPSLWAYPTILTLHTVGLSILVGANAAVDLSLLGGMRGAPIEPLEKLFPVMWFGFWINALSGTALFIADAPHKATQLTFAVKLLLVALGMLTVQRLRKGLSAGRVGEPGVVSRPLRILAGISLVFWAGAITAGRLLAYL